MCYLREQQSEMPEAPSYDPQVLRFSVVLGGSIGNDPYDPRTWSGSALSLVRALERARALDCAMGLKLPRWQDVALKARNFSATRQVWRLKYHLDAAYRMALTDAARNMLASSELSSSLLQVGAMYNLARATDYRVPCFSYHDGNIIEALKSGHGFTGVPARRIDEAIRFEREVAFEMTSVFTCSEYLRNSFIQDFGLNQGRVFNVGAGINLGDIPKPLLNKDYEKHDILFVGVDFDRKGGRELVSAFRIVRETLPTAQLHIVGPHRLPDSALQLGIVFHGYLSKSVPAQRNKLHELYREASVFVLPSKYEPFGIAPLEAMLFEVPCIVTDGWALREFVIPGINGALVEKGSVDSLAAALLKLLRAPEDLARMGRRGREMVLANYSWPKAVEKMKIAASSVVSSFQHGAHDYSLSH